MASTNPSAASAHLPSASSATAPLSMDEASKQSESDSPPRIQNNDSDLDDTVIHYLEFSTTFHESPVPTSTSACPHEPDSAPNTTTTTTDLPSAPDLSKYANPQAWPAHRKAYMTLLSCVSTLVTAYTAGAYASGAAQYSAEWGISRVAAFTGITVFVTFFAVAPMVLAPFSEIQGRRGVFVPAGVVYVIAQIGSAVTRSFAGMLVTRALAGIASSVFSTIVSGVLADMFPTRERNTPMTLFAGGTIVGTGLGPLVSGVVVQYLDWRWIYYIQIATCGVTVVCLLFFFHETRGSIILSRKASALNKWYEALERAGHVHRTAVVVGPGEKLEPPRRVRWKVRADEERDSIATMIKISLVRPFHLLFTESVVFWFSMWLSFAWAVLYMTFEALPLIFSTSHGFNDEQNGAVFSAICVAGIIGAIVGIWQGRFAARSPKVPSTPEGRLYFTCIQGMLLPIGLFWLGWTSFPSIHWSVPCVAVGCVTLGIFSTYLAVFNYFSDVYHRYASSANAAQSFCRNILAGAIPLFAPQMYKALSFQGASSLLGGVAILLSCVPWVLVIYGERIRKRSKIAMELVE